MPKFPLVALAFLVLSVHGASSHGKLRMVQDADSRSQLEVARHQNGVNSKRQLQTLGSIGGFGGVSIGGSIGGAVGTVNTGSKGKGEWDFCSANSECANGCCSNEYSGDGKLKCTPGGCGGGKTNGGDGNGNSNGNPKSPGNENQSGGGGKTDGGGGAGNIGGIGGSAGGNASGVGGSVGGGGTSTGTGSKGKGEWDFCSANSECANGCCSNEYSGDGKLKCTPGGCRG